MGIIFALTGIIAAYMFGKWSGTTGERLKRARELCGEWRYVGTYNCGDDLKITHLERHASSGPRTMEIQCKNPPPRELETNNNGDIYCRVVIRGGYQDKSKHYIGYGDFLEIRDIARTGHRR